MNSDHLPAAGESSPTRESQPQLFRGEFLNLKRKFESENRKIEEGPALDQLL